MPRREAARKIHHARDRILVALLIDPNPWIREEMDARGWRPVNLSFSSPPEGAVLRGALVNVRPDDQVVLDLRRRDVQWSGCRSCHAHTAQALRM
jgi:hypothetical protein